MPKHIDDTIMGGDYRRARAYVKREYPDMPGSRRGWWYAPLVEAHVKGAQAARRAKRTARQVGDRK